MIVVDTSERWVEAGSERFPCKIGRAGSVPADCKREGDGATPLGRWPVRGVLLRPDKGFVPPSGVAWRYLRRGDGWCDDSLAGQYNRPIPLPAAAGAERLSRDDDLYDAIIVLGHNDSPPVAGAGSAIFCHVAGDGDTEGCVALDRQHLARLIGLLDATSIFDIR